MFFFGGGGDIRGRLQPFDDLKNLIAGTNEIVRHRGEVDQIDVKGRTS